MNEVKRKEHIFMFVKRMRHFNLLLTLGRKHFKEINVQRVVISCYNLNAQTTVFNIDDARFYDRNFSAEIDAHRIKQEIQDHFLWILDTITAKTVLVGSSGSMFGPYTFPPLLDIFDLTCIWIMTFRSWGIKDEVACLRYAQKPFSSPKE